MLGSAEGPFGLRRDVAYLGFDDLEVEIQVLLGLNLRRDRV
jgi:hypothetical protein